MGMVLEGLFGLGLIVALLWLWTVRGSLIKDHQAAQQQAVQDAQAQERAAREARLYQSGVPLRCLGCEARFAGPLGEHGCPQCHLAALVVAEDDWERGQQSRTSRRAEGSEPHGNTNAASG